MNSHGKRGELRSPEPATQRADEADDDGGYRKLDKPETILSEALRFCSCGVAANRQYCRPAAPPLESIRAPMPNATITSLMVRPWLFWFPPLFDSIGVPDKCGDNSSPPFVGHVECLHPRFSFAFLPIRKKTDDFGNVTLFFQQSPQPLPFPRRASQSAFAFASHRRMVSALLLSSASSGSSWEIGGSDAVAGSARSGEV